MSKGKPIYNKKGFMIRSPIDAAKDYSLPDRTKTEIVEDFIIEEAAKLDVNLSNEQAHIFAMAVLKAYKENYND